MHYRITFLLLLSCLFILPSCKKECHSSCPWGCGGSYTLSGITTRDVNGALANVQFDSTDWRIDEQWCYTELNYFNQTNLDQYNNTGFSTAYRDSFLCLYQGNCTAGAKAVYGAGGYPNPFQSTFSLEIPDSGAAMMQMVLVNTQGQMIFNKVFNNTNPTSTTYQFQLTSQQADSGQTGRVYYMFKYPGSSYYFKGHGDMQAL